MGHGKVKNGTTNMGVREYNFSLDDDIHNLFCMSRYHDGGRLADQQMALLQYQRENLHFLSEEVLTISIDGSCIVR